MHSVNCETSRNEGPLYMQHAISSFSIHHDGYLVKCMSQLTAQSSPTGSEDDVAQIL